MFVFDCGNVLCETIELSRMKQAIPPRMRRRLLTTGAAAAAAGCHRVTILRAIQRGELQAVRLGRNGDHRIEAEALEAWLQPTHSEEASP
jgi:excisionase family DNA binding protein